MTRSDGTRGFAAAVGAFLIWGLLPVYLKALALASPLEVMIQRALWCCVFVLGWLAWKRALAGVKHALLDGPTRNRLMLSATLITVNWFVYVWAVHSGHVIETSLGYFINPLVNVVLGVLVLRERLNLWQCVAVACAVGGVAYLTWFAGRLPWISLVLACSFGWYGLIRKVMNVEAVTGLATETLLIFPFGLAALGWMAAHDRVAFGHIGWPIDVLLMLGGVVTAVPLALFSYGARLIPYSTIGLIQYLAPSLQLALGVWLFHEPMPRARLWGFCLIWLALSIYALDSLYRARRVNV